MAPSHGMRQRGPAILVCILSGSNSQKSPCSQNSQATDAREQRPISNRRNSRFITVDSVLGYHSDIPSMQARGPTANRPRPPRTASGRPADPKLAGRMVAPQHIPARSTKVSEKLVLLPEAEDDDDDDDDGIAEKEDYAEDNDARPTRDDEETLRRFKPGTRLKGGKSYAERLPKTRRAEKLARVTAYGTAQAYKLMASARFLKERHGARTKLYDDCLYVVYHLPLLPGLEGYRVRSSPVLKGIGGRAVVEEEIERSEGRDYGEGYFEDVGERFEVRGNEGDERRGSEGEVHDENTPPENSPRDETPPHPPETDRANSSGHGATELAFAEMFVFIYGVVVFWNFTERQEKDVLADLTFAEAGTGMPLATRAQKEEDFETEEFYFEYSPDTPRPRIFNDMITLRSGDHMIKLAMSHAIAQSTKLSFFEERMQNQMEEAQDVPKTLALTGTLGMERKEVVKILGALFTSRVDVNLCKHPVNLV